MVKNPPANAGATDSIPGLGRSTGEGKGYPLQYLGLENSMDCIVHGVTKSQTWLSDFHLNTWNLELGHIARWSLYCIQFSSVQSLSCVQLFATPWTEVCQASLSITNSQSLLILMSIESVMPSYHLILCRPFFLPPSIFPSIRAFSYESFLHITWPKYWSFSFSIRPSNEHPGLISFRMDWLDLLAVLGTLKSLLQHHSSNHQFFGTQLSS